MPRPRTLPAGVTIEGDLPYAGSPYDGHAELYDRLIASRLYNHLAWAADPADYEDFARTAVASASGPLLEVAAGTAIASAPAYRDSSRPVAITDRSRDMLTRAAQRIADGNSPRPGIRFTQADVFDLPFEPARFDTVLCLGFLHLVDDPIHLVRRLRHQLRPDGRLFLSSLVADTRVGTAYLDLLHRAGQVAVPRTADGLAQLFGTTVRSRGCMAYLELV
jgi:SAM-dependent methyltransferase